MSSLRRGGRWDPVTSRAYRPGDDLRLIDHRASARLSAVRGTDELIVREHFAEEAATVIVVVAGHPSMSLYPESLPWLHKPLVVDIASQLIFSSGRRARSRVENLTAGALDASLLDLDGPAGTFVFAISDFLDPVGEHVWTALLAKRFDVVPVVVQDPTWDQSFPDVAGVVLPVALPGESGSRPARLTQTEVEAIRGEHEARYRAALESLTGFGLDPIVLDTDDPELIFDRFVVWAETRRRGTAWAA